MKVVQIRAAALAAALVFSGAAVQAQAQKNIVDTAVAAGSFKTLAAALQAAATSSPAERAAKAEAAATVGNALDWADSARVIARALSRRGD